MKNPKIRSFFDLSLFCVARLYKRSNVFDVKHIWKPMMTDLCPSRIWCRSGLAFPIALRTAPTKLPLKSGKKFIESLITRPRLVGLC